MSLKLTSLLETRNLTKDFGGLVAIKDVTFRMHSGEVLGLIGPNGAGKTTLFNLVTGIERPDSGEVFFEGKSISKLLPHAICKLGISRTYQSVRPFLNHTVRDNILVGAIYGRPHSEKTNLKERVEEILDLLGLRERAEIYAKHLPIEERKIVEVGRALAANPKLLMLDEPMAGLNLSEVTRFVKLIRKLNEERGLSVLIVEHVMKAIQSACSRVVVLHHGEMLAEGTPDQVLTDERVIQVYLGESYSKQSK
ncbi:MAG TPA: ABC transporter ATP-binding protein [Nitrososphaerales archaeon]|nr:ABC transporter ATP-binding protein [Nitrososphaerales archaeon]